MWSFPVTFGGGIMMQNEGRSAGASATKYPASAQRRCQAAS